jgi:hypothetical protein
VTSRFDSLPCARLSARHANALHGPQKKSSSMRDKYFSGTFGKTHRCPTEAPGWNWKKERRFVRKNSKKPFSIEKNTGLRRRKPRAVGELRMGAFQMGLTWASF